MKLVLILASTVPLIILGQHLYQRAQPDSLAQLQQEVTALPEPPPRGTPVGHTPGGTRNFCDPLTASMTPILPSPVDDADFSGKTQEPHPTFWFYIPDEGDASIEGQFSLEDTDGNLLYRDDFTFSDTPGLVSISLPKTSPALQADESYRWHFRLYCLDANVPHENSLGHTGVVTYVNDPELAEQILAASPNERLALYKEHDLWHDSVAESDPNALNKLLSTIGLERLANIPIVQSLPTVSTD